MIIRIFRVLIREGKTAEFKRMVQAQSIPWLKCSARMLGYFPGAPMSNGAREFVMVTLWQDVASLQAFVGENWQTPVVTPDEAPLVERMEARHYAIR